MRSCLAGLLVFAVLLLAGQAAGKGSPLEERRGAVVREYFSRGLAERMRADASAAAGRFGGLNVFSTAQFGTSFLTGEADPGDIFDARIPGNEKIFRSYARDRLLVLNPPEKEGYCRYALAATRFVRELGYDAVLFRPDEFHPLFTRSTDTWMYLREEPVNPGAERRYYSAQVRARRVEVEGGCPMEALDSVTLCPFYVPSPASEYRPYRVVRGETVETTTRPEMINRYARTAATGEMRKWRALLGVAPCSLSFRRSVRVGAWVKADALEEKWKVGMRFSGSDRSYTWGACGLYVVPLDGEFWR